LGTSDLNEAVESTEKAALNLTFFITDKFRIPLVYFYARLGIFVVGTVGNPSF